MAYKSGLTSDSTDVLTNKTIDANGTGNSLSNVDVADLANGTDGELITWDASGVPATVAVGTAAQVLTSNGVGAAPTFQDAGGGGDMVVSAIAGEGLLSGATVTNIANGLNAVSFSDGANDYWQTMFKVPAGATSISSVKILFLNQAVSTNVYYQVYTGIYSSTQDGSFAQDSGVLTTFGTSANNNKTDIITAASADYNGLTIAENDVFGVRFKREAVEVEDTYGTTMNVITIQVTFA